MGKVDDYRRASGSPLVDVSGLKSEDRRIRGDRLEVCFPVIASHKGYPIQGFIEALNISWSGMLLLTNFPMEVGDQMNLEFTLPGREVPISAKCRVVRRIAESRPDEATQIGVAFEELDPNDQKIIAGFVLEYLPAE